MGKDTHLKIPKNSVHNEAIPPHGHGPSLKRDDYSKHGRKIYGQAIETKKLQSSKKDYYCVDKIILDIESPDEVGGIKNSKGNIEKLGFDFISYSETNKNKGTAFIKKSNYDIFIEKIDKYINEESHPNKTYLSFIEDLQDTRIEEKVSNEIDLESNDPVDSIISLYNVFTDKEKVAIVDSIREDLESNTISYDIHTFINGLTTISCTAPPKVMSSIFKEYSTIREIRKNHTAIIEQSIPIQDIPNPLMVSAPESNSLIGIIDSGIEREKEPFKSIVEEVIPYYPKGTYASPNVHGSFVASRCSFGDMIDECIITHQLNPYCKLIDIPVFGLLPNGKTKAPNENELMKILEDLIPKTAHKVKVYNLSIGFDIAITDYSFSPLAKLIDYLSKEFGVIIIIASGNIRKLLGPFPQDHFSNSNARIGPPSESLLSVTVGSIAKYDNPNSLSKINQLSPFSKIGPGSDKGIKPELIAHGGNLNTSYNPLPRISTYGIDNNVKKLSVDNGTSFAAPLVSQYAQRLFDLYPDSDANLIKALLFHFTNRSKLFNNITINEKHLTGYGEPDLESALFARENSCTYIYEGEISENNYQYVKFHIPAILASDNPNSKLRIKATIVFDPPVNPDNNIEYSKSRITAILIKPYNGQKHNVNLTTDERLTHAWNPIIKMDKIFSRNFSVGEWFLRLRLYIRGKLASSYQQKYAAVIQVIDEKNRGDVYSSILSEYGSVYQKIILNVAA